MENKSQNYKVLIVDDFSEIIELLKRVLRNIGNIEAEIATTGVQAFSKLQYFHPSLIILDAEMPGCNGEDFVKKIKKDDKLKNIKILGYTGLPAEGRMFEILGVDKVIIKSSKESEIDNLQKEIIKLLGIKDSR